mgnify:CR=1 FL=1
MASGYLQADVAGFTLGTHQGTAGFTFSNEIPLTVHSERGGTNNPIARSMPLSSVRWSHFELIMRDDTTSATIRKCQVFFSWDSDGDRICAGPSSVVEMVRCQNTGTDHMAAIDMDMVPTFPDGATANTVYAWVNTQDFNTTTATLILARLYWYELSKG